MTTEPTPIPAHLLLEGQGGHSGVQAEHVLTQQCSHAQRQTLHIPSNGANRELYCQVGRGGKRGHSALGLGPSKELGHGPGVWTEIRR